MSDEWRIRGTDHRWHTVNHMRDLQYIRCDELFVPEAVMALEEKIASDMAHYAAGQYRAEQRAAGQLSFQWS